MSCMGQEQGISFFYFAYESALALILLLHSLNPYTYSSLIIRPTCRLLFGTAPKPGLNKAA